MKRYSRKREAILDSIRSTPCHPSADLIYAQLKPEFPDLSLATVYRNIAAFIKSGDIVSIGVVGSKERYDGITSPHSHFICERCGAVIDVSLPENSSIDRETEAALGVRVTEHKVTFRGICSDCLKNEDMQA